MRDDAFYALVTRRDGHFALESGHHAALWLDLDALFARPDAISPFVARLAEQLAPYAPDVICGPLTGGAFLAQALATSMHATFAFTERVPASDGSALYATRYQLPRAYAEHVRGKRAVIVDDVMSAGSSLGATHDELATLGADVVAAAALLVLGSQGLDRFAARRIPVEAVLREPYELWPPNACPLCAQGVERTR